MSREAMKTEGREGACARTDERDIKAEEYDSECLREGAEKDKAEAEEKEDEAAAPAAAVAENDEEAEEAGDGAAAAREAVLTKLPHCPLLSNWLHSSDGGSVSEMSLFVAARRANGRAQTLSRACHLCRSCQAVVVNCPGSLFVRLPPPLSSLLVV